VNVIELQQRVKVPRVEVKRLIFQSLLAYPFPGAWRKLFSAGRKAVASDSDLA
jgi:hypothetical protein